MLDCTLRPTSLGTWMAAGEYFCVHVHMPSGLCFFVLCLRIQLTSRKLLCGLLCSVWTSTSLQSALWPFWCLVYELAVWNAEPATDAGMYRHCPHPMATSCQTAICSSVRLRGRGLIAEGDGERETTNHLAQAYPSSSYLVHVWLLTPVLAYLRVYRQITKKFMTYPKFMTSLSERETNSSLPDSSETCL